MKKLLTVLGVLALLFVIIVSVGQWMNTSDNHPGSEHGQSDGGKSGAGSGKNPAGCNDYEVLAAPGTWESSAQDDPLNPHANPKSLLLQITRPIREANDQQRVKVWTLPYTAQFKNFNAMHEKSYDDSRNEGTAKVRREMASTHKRCPATKFVLIGFSQGAVISGDLASEIGNGNGPVPADRIAGVALIADGRMERGVGELVGSPQVQGQGAEISLNPVSGLIQPVVPGATMRGPRPGGFGELQDRVKNFCAVDDMICDAPADLGNALQRARDLVGANGVHALYATNAKVIPGGGTAPKWIVGWVNELLQQPI